METIKDRITTRFNAEEKAELKLFMASFQIDNVSEAIHLSISWVNKYIKNVTESQIPNGYKMVLMRKLKSDTSKRKIYD